MNIARLLTLTVPGVGVGPAGEEAGHGLCLTLSDGEEEGGPTLPVCPGGVGSGRQQGGETADTSSPAEDSQVESCQSSVVTSVQLRIIFYQQLQELQIAGLGGEVDTRLALVVGQTR